MNPLKAIALLCWLAVGLLQTEAVYCQWLTGNQLRSDSTGQDKWVAGYSIGYTMGVFDSLQGYIFCAPKNATFGQIHDVIDKYMNEHPEEMHLSGDTLIVRALRVWPCEKREASDPVPSEFQGRFRTGAQIRDGLGDATNTASSENGLASGYVVGVVEALDKIYFCIPGGVTSGNLWGVVRKHVKEQPSDVSELGNILVGRSFLVWPCPKSGPSTPQSPSQTPRPKPVPKSLPTQPASPF
jgi:hypothetical protein